MQSLLNQLGTSNEPQQEPQFISKVWKLITPFFSCFVHSLTQFSNHFLSFLTNWLHKEQSSKWSRIPIHKGALQQTSFSIKWLLISHVRLQLIKQFISLGTFLLPVNKIDAEIILLQKHINLCRREPSSVYTKELRPH